MSRPVREHRRSGSRRARAIAATALVLLAAGLPGSACGGPGETVRYRDVAYRVSFSYDGAQFTEGALASGPLIARAERAAGAEPVSVVEVVARGPGGDATGLRVAVFEAPGDVGSMGFWRATDQVLDEALARARRAVALDVAVGDPKKARFAGLQGYSASLSVEDDDVPVRGIVLALWREPYVYEVVVACRTVDGRLLDELTRMLVGLRLGTGPPLAT